MGTRMLLIHYSAARMQAFSAGYERGSLNECLDYTEKTTTRKVARKATFLLKETKPFSWLKSVLLELVQIPDPVLPLIDTAAYVRVTAFLFEFNNVKKWGIVI